MDGGGADASASAGPPCASDDDCIAVMPQTSPPGCAIAKCDTLLGMCTYVAKDNDSDGHSAANCKSTGGPQVQAGDDCDDTDPNLYPGHPEQCAPPAPDGGLPSNQIPCQQGQISCELDGTRSTCTGAVTCLNQSCVGGQCAGVCATGQTQCAGNGVQTCDDTGHWGTAAPCVNQACVGGTCVGSCAPNALKCNGLQPMKCDANGNLQDNGGVCSQGCINGVCTTCMPNTVTCLSTTTLQTCNVQGQPSTTDCSATNQTCYQNRCTGVCAPGQAKTCNPGACNESTISCDATGNWPCPAPSNPTWNGLAVGQPCTQGTGACQGTGTVVCAGSDAATCNAAVGTVDQSFHTSPAPNGSWDWNCDGQITLEYSVYAGLAPLCSSPGAMCTSQGSNQASCLSGTPPPGYPSNLGYQYVAACGQLAPLCGASITIQECYFSSGTCKAGASALAGTGGAVNLGCR